METSYLPTGNEWVSLPSLKARTGALESFFLSCTWDIRA